MNRLLIITGIVLMAVASGSAQSPSDLERKIDSLFVIASSGELKYRDMTQPAIDSIAAIGAPSVPWLVEKFSTKSARERWTVIWILQKIGSEAVPYLVKSLKRPEGLIVQRVCWALGDIKDTTSVEPLMEVADHPRWQVRDQAVEALGKIGDTRANQVVMRSLADSIGQVRKSAVVSCGKLKTFSAVSHLVHRLGDEFYGARLAASEALLKLDTTRVIEVLTDSLESSDVMVGNLACHVLGQIGTNEAINVLFAEIQEAASPERRAHAGIALIKADPLDNCGYRNEILEAETDRFVRLKLQSAVTEVQHGTE